MFEANNEKNLPTTASESPYLVASSPHRSVASLTAVGLGPGDPELVTMKGVRAIADADVIFVPRSRNGEQSLALRIAAPWIAASQLVVELALPMTRDAAQLVPAWQAAADQIAATLADLAQRKGELALGVYLLLGDPLLYGTFTYIWGELAARHSAVAIEIIPGITSFAAAAAHMQVVLGTTSERVAIIPAVDGTDAESLHALFASFETVVLMKVGRNIAQVVSVLEALDLLDNAVYAEHVGMPEERIVRDVRALAGQVCPYLSLVIVRR